MKDFVAIDHYAGLQKQLRPTDLPWFSNFRTRGLDSFAGLGFPKRNMPGWEHLNLSSMTELNFASGIFHDDIDFSQTSSLFEGAKIRLVFINGIYSEKISSLEKIPAGLIVTNLQQALAQYPKKIEPLLGHLETSQTNAFSALNAAFLTDGAYVELANNITLTEPIYLIFISTANGTPTFSCPRNLVVAGVNSQATLVEHYVGHGDSVYWTNAVSEMYLERGALVEHYKVQTENENAFHTATLHVRQNQDSQLSSHSFALGGQISRTNLNLGLEAPGTSCSLNGLYIAGNSQQVDHHVLVDHHKPMGQSKMLFKGVLDGKSKGVFSGKVVVHPDAQKTDAKQTNKNLLLSSDAEVAPQPELEIYADDVKCSHGATVGQLDANALFYLQSRGIDLALARNLLTYAFASELIKPITVSNVSYYIERVLTHKLHHGHFNPGFDDKSLLPPE